MIDIIVQIGLFLFGAGAVLVVGMKKHRFRRWGYVLGLCGQPFWFYLAIDGKAWGVFLLVCIYTFSWGYGLKNNWGPS